MKKCIIEHIRDSVFLGALLLGFIFMGLSIIHNLKFQISIPQDVQVLPSKKPDVLMPGKIDRVKPKITTRSARELNYKKLMKALETGTLSSKEALFYKKLEEKQ